MSRSQCTTTKTFRGIFQYNLKIVHRKETMISNYKMAQTKWRNFQKLNFGPENAPPEPVNNKGVRYLSVNCHLKKFIVPRPKKSGLDWFLQLG